MDIDVMEPEMLLTSDKAKGIKQPGIAQGMTYVDCNGNVRRKYETLHTITSTTASQHISAKTPDIELKVEDTRVEDVPVPPEDIKLDPAEEVQVEVPVVEPKPVPKPVRKKAPPKKPVSESK